MGSKEKTNFETLILKLLKKKDEVTLRDVADEAGLTADSAIRRSIQRAFKSLIEKGSIEPRGQARARAYVLIRASDAFADLGSVAASFENIPLAPSSRALLAYVSQKPQARVPVGYKQDFLRSYEPNRTFYLDESQRDGLMTNGRVENVIRPAGTYARNILNRLLIDLSWNSSRLEGNTYSLLETKRLLEQGEDAEGKDATETQMILNHKDAIEYIIESANEKAISAHEICSIHALLSENLLGDPSASGRLRQIIVNIGGSTYMPLENPYVLKECFEIVVEKINAISDPFEQSFFSLVHLSYLQAFEDVNKRTARLVANIPFVKHNLKPLSFTDVSQAAYVKALLGVYERNDFSLMRDLFVWAYSRSALRYSAIQQSMGVPNALRLKYRTAIQNIVRAIVLEMVPGSETVAVIRKLIANEEILPGDFEELFKIVETEIMSLHDGNIARFRLRPSEFEAWKIKQ